MAYRAKNGKTYPYKEMPWQYRERTGKTNNSGDVGTGCLGLIIGFGLLIWIFGG